MDVGLLARIDALILKGDSVLKTHEPNPPNVLGYPTLDNGEFNGWRSQTLAVLARYGVPYKVFTEQFQEVTKSGAYIESVESGLGILKAIKEDVEADIIFTSPKLVAKSNRSSSKDSSTMDVLLTWSGPTSHDIAGFFHTWLPGVLPGIKPWISDQDIAKGKKWFPELTAQLDKSHVSITFITPENVRSPWVYYEVGFIAAKMEDGFVCPYLVGVDGKAVKDTPLGQYQWHLWPKKMIHGNWSVRSTSTSAKRATTKRSSKEISATSGPN